MLEASASPALCVPACSKGRKGRGRERRRGEREGREREGEKEGRGEREGRGDWEINVRGGRLRRKNEIYTMIKSNKNSNTRDSHLNQRSLDLLTSSQIS